MALRCLSQDRRGRVSRPSQKNVAKEWKQPSFAWEKRPHVAAPESTRWIEAVSVFDTVDSLGIPKLDGLLGIFANPLLNLAGDVIPVEKAGFHNVALSPCKYLLPRSWLY